MVKFATRHNLALENENILVACSGGPDSVALLHALKSQKDLLKINIFVAHVNHNLRANSQNDALFVESLAKRLGLPFLCKSVTVESVGNVEDNARKVRHQSLNEMATEARCSKIALGHTSSDKAETVLHNIARGAGTKGFSSLRPSNGNIIRPILFASRKDVLDYLGEIGQDYITDETNADTAYSRNRIRHNVIPELEQIFPQASRNIARLSGIIEEESEFLNELAKESMERCIIEAVEGRMLSIPVFAKLHFVLQRRLLLLLCQDEYLSLSHLDDLIKFILHSEPNKRACLGVKTFVKVDKHRLQILP